MTARSPDLDPQTVARLKQEAAERAVDFVQSGMVVGLGTGSTTIFAVRRIGHRLADRSLRDIIGVPTSAATEAEARSLGIPLLTNDLPREVDLTIDGADEVDPRLDLIKGGGGALLREKIVAQASRREIIVVDQTKLSDRLGTRYRLPVEVLPFGSSAQQRYLERLGARVTLRLGADDKPFRTDSGNLILDCDFGPITDPARLAEHLGGRAGIVEHGLFIGIATDLIVAGANGIEHRQRDPSPRPR